MDTRDLIEKRDELKQQVLSSFIETFPHYEDMTDEYDDIRFEEEEIQDWKDEWLDEIAEIGEIDVLEDEISSREFDYGLYLIEDNDWEDYVQELLEDCGYIPRDFPSWIEIDWNATAKNVKEDYSEVEFQGKTYFYRV